jgi:hypothetical protein
VNTSVTLRIADDVIVRVGANDVRVVALPVQQIIAVGSSTAGPVGPVGPVGAGGALGYWGSFYDMTDQSLASITQAQPVQIGATADGNGVTVENGDEITFAHAGVYSLTFSIQITNLSNTIQKAIFWLKLNGNDYADSATELDLQPRKSAGTANHQVITINYVAEAAAGDAVQVFWSGTSTNLKVESLPAGTTPVSPAVPSIILTATQVMYTQVGPTGPSGARDLAVTTIASSATPTINTDNCEAVTITALATAITSMSTNLSGTPANFDRLLIRIKDNGTARAINWGAAFVASGVALPTTTVASKVTTVEFLYDSVKAAWGCVASVVEL